MARKKPLTKEEQEAKNLARNLKNNAKNKIVKVKKAKHWTKGDYEQYYAESEKLSDYTCGKGGVIAVRSGKPNNPYVPKKKSLATLKNKKKKRR